MIGMILAAGRGERMMPLTKNTPKSLIKDFGVFLVSGIMRSPLPAARIMPIIGFPLKRKILSIYWLFAMRIF